MSVARHHAEQCTFPDTGSREQADALAATDRQQAVDAAHADGERLLNAFASQRIRRHLLHAVVFLTLKRTLAIDRLPEPVNDAPEQLRSNRNLQGSACRYHVMTWTDRAQFAERHQQDIVVAKADDLG